MSKLLRHLEIVALITIFVAAPLLGHSVAFQSSGLVVEGLAADSAAAKAGIRVEDQILSYDEKPLYSPAELQAAEQNTFGKTEVVLEVQRGEATLRFAVSLGALGIQAQPALSIWVAQQYHEGRTALAARQPEQALANWEDAARQAQLEGEPLAAAWLYGLVGGELEHEGNWIQAAKAHLSAWELVKESSDWAAQSRALLALGRCRQNQNDFSEAAKRFEQARQADEVGGYELWVSGDLSNLGKVSWNHGDLTSAENYFTDSLAIRERLTPNSLVVADNLSNLGGVSFSRGNLAEAEDYSRRALAIRENLAPNSLDLAGSLNNLGLLMFYRGDLAAAEDYQTRALVIREQLTPDSLLLATSLNNLGLVARNRGDLAVAEDYHARALAIRERLNPDSLDVAVTFISLGNVLGLRGDLAAAREYQRRALAIQERLAPDSVDVAASLSNLGELAEQLGDLTAAEEYNNQALNIRERLAPGSLNVATSFNNLGDIAFRRRDLATAQDYYSSALAIQKNLAPNSLAVAGSLILSGKIALVQNHFDEAEKYDHDAVTITERLAPGSKVHAETLAASASVAHRKGQLAEADAFFERALTALDQQTLHLGGGEESRSGFRAEYASIYKEYSDLLLEEEKPELAFQVLERSRARTLLEMLAERDLVFAADLPAELTLARKRNDADYDRVQGQIAELNPDKDSAQIDQHLARLRELRSERDQIAQKIRKSSPHLAALQYPQPLSAAEAKKSLDAGTVLLSYSVGKDHTTLFVLRADEAGSGLSVFHLPEGEDALQERVGELRKEIISWDRSSRDEFRKQAHQLYDLLIAPAESLLKAGDRILISPDGPLDTLPFATLLRSDNQYLVQWKPLHTVLSATLYSEIKNQRSKTSYDVDLVAFGDPLYPATEKQPGEVRSATERGFKLSSLPFSRIEVNAIMKLYPARNRIYLGAAATEEHAKEVGKSARYLHFATHAMVDERFPLNSALVLTIPEKPAEGQENGLLQAWEIFEQMRINADLVTLSACDTALGKEVAGEGLIGLTRAFQYAGAHSVLASLWRIPDASTSEFMKRFYGYLKQGQSKDEALRHAQSDLMHLPQFARPLYWAGFVLSGDWQ